MTTTALLDRLDHVRQSGPDRWVAHCPAQDDRALDTDCSKFSASLDLATAARWYCQALGVGLVPIPPVNGKPTKGPTSTGWNHPDHVITDPVKAFDFFKAHTGYNLGLHHGMSGTAVIDVDSLEHTHMVFAELGWDYDALLAGAPRIQGRPGRDKALFRVPEGVSLKTYKLAWPDRDGKTDPKTGKVLLRTVFELRAGAVQDVLPPSIHPDTMRPYEWRVPPTEIPPLPAELWELWVDWEAYREGLEACCPWAPLKERPLPKRDHRGVSVIAKFNEAHDVRSILEAYGYQPKGKRYLAPGSESGIPGVKVFKNGKAFSHHGSDPLADGHAHDAFDVYRLLEHDGDFWSATKAAAEVLGIKQEQSSQDSAKFAPKLAPKFADPISTLSLRESKDSEASNTTVDQSSQSSHGFDCNVPLPTPSPAMLYGLAGEVGRAAAEGTEVNPYAACMAFLTFFAAQCGRDVYMPIGNTWHHPCLYSLHVGRTAEGRKGDALSLPRRIARAIRQIDENLLGQYHGGGLSSREGLVYFIHDGYREGKKEVPAIEDKRLHVVESEFSNILHQGKRNGNTLSSALRDAWDGNSIQPATKHNRVFASDPHICLTAGITPEELRKLISDNDITNGFLNRFIVFWAERPRIVAFPQATPDEKVRDLAERTAEAIRFALRSYPVEQDTFRLQLSPSATARYREIYEGELAHDGSLEMGALLVRRAPYLLRLAMVFALLDKTATVSVAHIEAAYAWVTYWKESVRFVFADRAERRELAEVKDVAHKVIEALHKHGGEMDRKSILTGVLGGHVRASVLDDALKSLLMANPPRIALREEYRQDGRGGRPKKYYCELCELCSSEPETRSASRVGEQSDDCELRCEVSANFAKLDQSSHAVDQDVGDSTTPNRHNTGTAEPLMESPTLPSDDTLTDRWASQLQGWADEAKGAAPREEATPSDTTEHPPGPPAERWFRHRKTGRHLLLLRDCGAEPSEFLYQGTGERAWLLLREVTELGTEPSARRAPA